jgi:hypothetical protein
MSDQPFPRPAARRIGRQGPIIRISLIGCFRAPGNHCSFEELEMRDTTRRAPDDGEVLANQPCHQRSAATSEPAIAVRPAAGDDWRLERLIDRLPQRLREVLRALRQPSRRWLRIPASLLLIAGGILAFLPILGVWMLPLGLVLLAEDAPALRGLRSRILDWVERRHPRWLQPEAAPRDPSDRA